MSGEACRQAAQTSQAVSKQTGKVSTPNRTHERDTWSPMLRAGTGLVEVCCQCTQIKLLRSVTSWSQIPRDGHRGLN